MSGPESKGEAPAEAQPASAAPLEPFRLGAEPPHVMRLSRKALAILGGASGIAIGGALLYALQPAAQKAPDNLYDSDRPNKSELVTGAPADYGKAPMRVSEALNLDVGDIDLEEGVLTIRNTKFGKSRLVPVHATTLAVLRRYRQARDAFLAGRIVKPFFVSTHGRRITIHALDRAFWRLTCRLVAHQFASDREFSKQRRRYRGKRGDAHLAAEPWARGAR